MMSTVISLQPLVLCSNMNVLFQVFTTFTSLILTINLSKNLDSYHDRNKANKICFWEGIFISSVHNIISSEFFVVTCLSLKYSFRTSV